MVHDRAVRFPSRWAVVTCCVVGLLASAIALLTLKSVFSALKISALLTVVFAAFIVATDYALAKREQYVRDA